MADCALCVYRAVPVAFFEKKKQDVEDGFDMYGHEEKKLGGKFSIFCFPIYNIGEKILAVDSLTLCIIDLFLCSFKSIFLLTRKSSEKSRAKL